MNTCQLNLYPQIRVFLCIYFLFELSLACKLNEDYTPYYLLEIEARYLEKVKSLLDEDEFNLGYAGHVIADLHLFQRLKSSQGPINEKLVEKIQEKTQRRVKRMEHQCLQRLLPEEIVPDCFEHGRKIRRSLLPQKEGCDPLHILGVYKAWEQNYTGQNIRILIVDNGVDNTHPDLKNNFDKSMCFDAWSGESSCNPYVDYLESEDIHHGTQCAGLIAGEKGNNICGDGVAYHAIIGAVRLFNIYGEAFDAEVGRGLSYKRDEVDIYSSSFGYQSEVYESLGSAAQKALTEGAKQGRKGKGSIYVFPSGNGGSDAHCNRNGYARSIYTITIGSVGFDGNKATYTELCPCVLATTFGEGGDDFCSKLITAKSMITRHDNCTWKFRGSSVSAALASGVFALTLEANNNLTSRDIQHLLVRTSDTNGTLWKADWRTNGAGHRINDWFGFGLINASEMVRTAQTWKPVDALHICTVTNAVISEPNLMTIRSIKIATQVKSDGCKKSKNDVSKVEHVEVKIGFETDFPYQLNIILMSPMETNSTLMRGTHNKSITKIKKENFTWTLMSAQFWDENPEGTWELVMEIDDTSSRVKPELTVYSVELVLYGTSVNEDKKDSQVPEKNGHKESSDSGSIFTVLYDSVILYATPTCILAVFLLILFTVFKKFGVLERALDFFHQLLREHAIIQEGSLYQFQEEQTNRSDSTINVQEKEEMIPLVPTGNVQEKREMIPLVPTGNVQEELLI